MTGNVQQVGGVDGVGSVTVSDGASLTADHVHQSSLVIGNGSMFALAPSDASGNPMALPESASGGFVLASSLAAGGSFASTTPSLLAPTSASAVAPAASLLGGLGGDANAVSAVPEPSTVILLLAAATILAVARRRLPTSDLRPLASSP
jgi:hypothetical protein